MGKYHLLSEHAQRLGGHTSSDRDAEILSITVSADRQQRSLTSCALRCSTFCICTIPASAPQSLQIIAWFRLSAGWIYAGNQPRASYPAPPRHAPRGPPSSPPGEEADPTEPMGAEPMKPAPGAENPCGAPLCHLPGEPALSQGGPCCILGDPLCPRGVIWGPTWQPPRPRPWQMWSS